MTNSKATHIVPLFDPKKWEKIERQLKIKLQDGGNWLPQDACGGHQWNAAINKWVI